MGNGVVEERVGPALEEELLVLERVEEGWLVEVEVEELDP